MSDSYADRRLDLMERMGEARELRSFAPTQIPVGSGPRIDMAPGYGTVGAGGWQQGMIWQGSGASSSDQAMRLSAVFGCWRILSDAISTLPLGTYTRKADGSPVQTSLPNYLTFEIPQMSRIVYLCQVVLSILADGNAFIATPRDDLGTPTNLIPLDPSIIEPRRERGKKLFRCHGVDYDEFDVMHIQWMTMPGSERGISPIRAMRDVIDTSAKAQEYGRAFMGNNAVPPAVIEVPAGNDDAQDPAKARLKAQRVAEIWNETHGGASNAGKVGVLTGGASLKTIALSPEDAQWLDSKRFGVSEIARFYGVPPHLLADASNSTSWGSGLAEQNSMFGQLSLSPLTERIDEAHTRLLTTDGRREEYVKLNLDAKLRADRRERMDMYAVMVAWHLATPNECRAEEDLSPLEGGDAWPDPTLPPPKPKMPPITK